MENRLRGMVLVGGAALLWSTGGLLAHLITDADRWTTVFWRSVSAFAFLLIFIAIRDGRRTPEVFRAMGLPGVAVGLCFTVASIGLVVALSLTSVANTLVILSATPLVAAVFGRIFLGERIDRVTYATIAVVIAGIVLMVSGTREAGSYLGDAAAGAMAVAYAGAIVISRRYSGIRMTPATCLGVAVAAVISFFLAAPLSVTLHDGPVIFVFGAVHLGAGLALFVTGVRLIPAAHTALLAMLEPILGPVWVWLALGERPAASVLIGGVIVILAVAAKTFHDLRMPRNEVAVPTP